MKKAGYSKVVSGAHHTSPLLFHLALHTHAHTATEMPIFLLFDHSIPVRYKLMQTINLRSHTFTILKHRKAKAFCQGSLQTIIPNHPLK
ncbi:unnamed protein product [Phytomonas sp. Hart1]|nr:unnamed protein product [Phytomonas sp. Hart1]|eukprot:CCW66503.1 unnamed protein product [Phytomonas sp. isolate Hart1]